MLNMVSAYANVAIVAFKSSMCRPADERTQYLRLRPIFMLTGHR
jgi:hypothetical protein